MSKSVIDERVVQMSFDNDQFEKGVSQTIDSLSKLDNSLDKISGDEYFSRMEDGVKRIERAFSTSGMVINGILLNIGQTINGYLKQGLNSLISGIRSGMQEYETQMGATQTILANVKDEGKGIDDVTAALDELNRYADLTIYNFTEMTRNIGMFTAAGANLDTSVATIKGLANAAALVGANATTAARAWYQVSQAMAAGSFKLMDWRSLETSNIAGEGFKSVIMEVARKDGVAIDELIKKYGGLRDTLRDGWLTADRFAEAMRILSGDLTEDQIIALGYTEEQAKKLYDLAKEAVDAATKVKTFAQLVETTGEEIGSGWAVTFRTIIGDFEKAREFYTRVSKTLNNAIGKISAYRNKFLDEIWNVGGSKGTAAVRYFKKTIDNLLAIFSTFIGAVRTGFDNIFPWTRIRENIADLGKFLEDTSHKFVLNTANTDPDQKFNPWDLDKINKDVENLIRIFRGLFAGIDVILTTIGDTISWVVGQIPGISSFFDNLKEGNKGLISNIADIMDNVTKFRDILVEMKLIPRILNLIKQEIFRIIATNPILRGMVNIVSYAIAAVRALGQTFLALNINPLMILLGVLKMIGGAIIGVIAIIGQAINKVVEFFTGVTDFSFFQNVGNEILIFIGLMNELGKGTITVAQVFEWYKQKVLDAFDSIMNSPFVQGIIGFFTNLWDTIQSIGENIKNTFIQIGEYFNNLFKDYNIDLGKVGIFGALTAGVLLLYKVLKDVDGIVSLAGRFGEVLAAIANKINSEALWNVAKSVGVLSASLFLLSLVPYEKLLDTASVVIAVLMMVLALTAVIKGTFDAIGKIREGLEPFEKAIENITEGLSAFLKKAGWAVLLESIGDALLKVVIAVIALAAAFKFMPNEINQAIGVIVSLAAAFGFLALMFSLFSEISVQTDEPIKDIQEIANGVKQFAKFAGIALVIESISNAIIKISLALALLAKVSESGADVWTAVGQLAAIMALLGGLMITMEILSKNAKPSALLSVSVAMVAFGAVVTALSGVAALIGLLPGDVLLKGLGTVGIIMVVMGTMISIISYNSSYYAASTFLSLAAVMAAMSIGIAAIIAASSLIQNETQLQAMTNGMIGLGVLLVVTFAAMAIMSKFDTDVTGMLAMAAVMGTLALVVVAIAGAIKMLEGVKVSDQVLNTLTGIIGILALVSLITAIMSIVIAGLGPEISVFADLALVGMAMAVAAWGYVAQSIGKCALDLAQSQIVFQDALYGWWSILVYVSSLGDTFTRTLAGAAETIINAVPNLFGFFVTVGVAIGTAMIGILLGLELMIGQIVLNACTMILTIIIKISDWINENADLIQTALVKVFRALLNIAIIAINVVLLDAIPSIVAILVSFMYKMWGTVMSIISNLIGMAFEAIGNAILEQFGDDGVMGLIGTTFLIFGYGFQDLAVIIHDAIDSICGFLEIGIDVLTQGTVALDLFTTSTQEMEETVDNSNSSIAKSTEKLESVFTNSWNNMLTTKKDGTKVTKDVTDEYLKGDKKIQTSSSETADVYIANEEAKVNANSEATTQMTNNEIDFANIQSMITDGSLGDMVSQFTSFFDLNLDNQGSYIDSILSNEAYLGEGMNSLTKQYLDAETNMYNEYYSNAAEAVEKYYDTRNEATKKAQSGDYAGAKALYEDANAQMKTLSDEYKITQEMLLNDIFDYDGKGVFTTGALKKAQQDSWSSLASDFSDMWSSYTPSDIKTDAYKADYGSSVGDITSNNDVLKDELSERNDLVKNADSELTPKDLTPTIDLDSLKNEVNQANGIMTGSLLAAQNAAIGDYINTDSELNPFLKDRYQNTYNFTQNNYSPKALSRIDIYRQTQNQLRLSRGF